MCHRAAEPVSRTINSDRWLPQLSSEEIPDHPKIKGIEKMYNAIQIKIKLQKSKRKRS
jgi:hypothetical protein